MDHLRRGLSLGSGPDEKVASDFTSVPDPSERRCGGRSTEFQNKKRFGEEMKKRIVEIAVKVVVAALTAFLTAITTTSCLGHAPIIL